MNSFKALGITVETNGTLTTKMGITVAPSVTAAVDFENTMLPNAPQRIRVPYDITFAASTTGAGNTVFPAAGGLPLELDLHVWLQASGQKVPGSDSYAAFEFVAGADPYFTNVDIPRREMCST